LKRHTVSKRYLAVVLVMALVLGMVPIAPTAAATTASDISGHWAEEVISRWQEQGLISGYEDGTIRPNNQVTRAEFMAFVNRVFKFNGDAEIEFSDVPVDVWYATVVRTAVAAGYIGGYPDGTMRPTASITRQEAAAIISRVLGLEENAAEAERFTDAASIPAWSKGVVGAVAAVGAMGGYPDGSFGPINNITRAEAVSALDRVMPTEVEDEDWVIVEAGTYGPETGIETFDGNVIIQVEGVTLQNYIITGDLIIAEEVGDGDVTLQNVEVQGEMIVRGGGDSVYIYGGQIARVVIEGTPSGLVRIVVYDVEGMEVVIAEQAADEQIILEGSFEQVTVKAANAQIETRGETAIAQMVIEETATAVTVTTSDQTTIEKAVVNGETPVFQGGKGTIKEVEGTAADSVEDLDDVIAKPEEPEEPGDDPGPGGPVIVSVKGVTVAGEAIVGATLTATPSPSAATVRYQWQRAESEDGTYENISGATSRTYTLTTDDVGKWIRVQVTGTGIYVGTRTSTPVGVVDKSALEAKVNEALGLNEDDYTEESWAAFAAALADAEAVLADPEATQAEVDDALAALVAAMDNLEPKEPPVVDKSALEAKVNEARGLNAADYTEESWAAFAAALADAEAVLANPEATQAEVDDALAALVGAMDNLEPKEPPVVDKSALEAKVNEARGLNAADYTEESWAAFAAALADAEAVLANPEATQAEVDDALEALVGAMDNLEPKEPPVVDKSALEAKVNEARGLNAADYTEESWAAFCSSSGRCRGSPG
jgi:flagellar biosynthesis regulator FlaF